MCTMCLLGVHRGKMRMIEMELQMAVNHYMGAWNQTYVLRKNSKYSFLISELSLQLHGCILKVGLLALGRYRQLDL